MATTTPQPQRNRLVSLRRLAYALRHPVETFRFAAGTAYSQYARWRADDYEEYYCRVTKRTGDFRALVGSAEDFETMRDWQLGLCKREGLAPGDTLLDLGCGVLRGGVAFIDYLQPGNYVGLDISQTALMHGHRRVHEAGLDRKRPTLIRNDDLSFDEVAGLEADCLLAQSVWSHLPPGRLDDCLANMRRALADGGTVLATYNEADGDAITSNNGPRRDVDYSYPHGELVRRAEAHGWDVACVDVEHPNGQTVVRLERE